MTLRLGDSQDGDRAGMHDIVCCEVSGEQRSELERWQRAESLKSALAKRARAML